jgi:hypothetical protein
VGLYIYLAGWLWEHCGLSHVVTDIKLCLDSCPDYEAQQDRPVYSTAIPPAWSEEGPVM